jgi:hypothetical protein
MLVRFRPMAKRSYGGPGGSELEFIDDLWKLGAPNDKGIPIENIRTNHGTILPYDHIHHYSTDIDDHKGRGFLTLTSQVSIGW